MGFRRAGVAPAAVARGWRAGAVALVTALIVGGVTGGVAGLGSPAGAAAGTDRLRTGETLSPGQSLVAGAYVLTMQPDGNLVLYTAGRPVWFSGTYGAVGSRLVMQPDGNLVIYNPAGAPIWYTGTLGVDGAVFIAQPDGNLVVYSGAANPMWARFGMPVAANDAATVTRVVDGDTIEANGVREPNIRMIGLNAMETGECRANQAANRLRELLAAGGNRVRLTARDRTSTTGGEDGSPRPRRSIVVASTGVDPAAVLIREGLALWFPNKQEFLHNAQYAPLAAQAAAARRGLWNPDGCGVGPYRNAVLRVDVSPVGAETVTVTNTGTVTVSLDGWWVRDGLQRNGKRGFSFPAGTVLAAGRSVVLPTTAVFDDPTGRPESMGDGAYLFDPDGDIRAAHQYGPVEFHVP